MKHKHKFNADMAGELWVTGKDKIEIKLHVTEPEEIYAEFVDELEIVPCNPNHCDSLEMEVHWRLFHYVLVIKWDVSAVREIVWAVRN